MYFVFYPKFSARIFLYFWLFCFCWSSLSYSAEVEQEKVIGSPTEKDRISASATELLDLSFIFQDWNDSGPKYKLNYKGFSSASPNILIFDNVEIVAKDFEEGIALIAKRYSSCFSINVDHEDKEVQIERGTKLFFVKSKHVTNSEYSVEGGAEFSLETNNETRERYFCVHRPGLLKHGWQRRAFPALAR